MTVSSYRRWVWSAVAAAVVAGTAAAQSPPIVTKNAALRLPVSFDDRSGVAAIKLYVQGPSGRWECVETGAASQEFFEYKAPADGEYKFTFVVVDRRGQATPASVETAPPHRIVAVDTTPPDVTVKPTATRDGTALQCNLADASPDWSSLRASFLSQDGSWQTLHPIGKESPTLFRVPSPSVLQGRVRVTAADRAGNRVTKEFDLGDPTASTKPMIDKQGKPDPAMFLRDGEPTPPKTVKPASGVLETPKIPTIEPAAIPSLPDVPAAPKTADPTLDLKLPDLTAPATPPIAAPKKAEPDLTLPAIPSVAPARKTEPDLTMPAIPPVTASKKAEPDYRIPDGVPTKAESLKLPDGPAAAPPGGLDLKLPNDVPPPPAIPAAKGTAMKPANPPTPNPTKPTGTAQLLNTRTCEIAYELDGGARFANKMTFWATADNGRTWMPLKDSSSGASPAKLTLPSDGLFGIRLRPGGSIKPPEPGEEPDQLIEIDSTKPTVTLLQPTIGNDEGTMTLNWTASDPHLLGNSINLYYALKAEGPWEVIVSGYKNEGVYKWTLPTTLAGAIHLRVEAMDMAGNIGRVELPNPVTLEVGKQRVKVTGVSPGK